MYSVELSQKADKFLEKLRQKEFSLRELKTKTNTGYSSIKKNRQELKFLKIIELRKHEKSDANGRQFTTARITNLGRNI